MKQAAIFGPVLAMMAVTFVVWVLLYARRIPFIRASGLTPRQLATPGLLARESPPAVANPADNFRNLFEIPVLFYVLALLLFVTQRVDTVALYAAWIFVAFRVLHSAVHCTVNIVMLRFSLYLISTLALWFIAARAIVQYLSA
jgi:hypothetical protein